ncbi:hypothetical protein ACQ4PT_028528 [Festuca glaucescens]
MLLWGSRSLEVASGMGNCRWRGPAACLLLWFLLGFELCASLNHEGLALLRFREMVEADPSGALAGWDGGDASPCSWFGVECSDDGRVVGLNLANLGLKSMLPPEIGQLTSMHSLILHKNFFYGIIPTEVGDLRALKVLDLGYNNFNGPIPSELINILSLEFIFLKGNRLYGGLPLELNELISLCESRVHQYRTLSNRMSTARRSELETACEDFSNVIGTLPGCTLYKGTLPCGAEIAVVSTLIKYAYGWSPLAEAQFRNKVETLSQVNHKNFVKLLGYCEDEEPFTRMMVFEYVSNGSLFEHLHVKEAEHLDWQARLRIVMGVIYCLNHLYQEIPPMILRNLDSSCIYLTEDNAAKISDDSFGGDKKDSEDEFDEPDECAIVYKFALLLLETISGRRPFSNDSGLLILWAHRYLTGEKPLTDMVDPTLKSAPVEQVRALTELVKLCINDNPWLRPTVAEVTRWMQEITGFSEDHSSPRNSALWWAEIEILTS